MPRVLRREDVNWETVQRILADHPFYMGTGSVSSSIRNAQRDEEGFRTFCNYLTDNDISVPTFEEEDIERNSRIYCDYCGNAISGDHLHIEEQNFHPTCWTNRSINLLPVDRHHRHEGMCFLCNQALIDLDHVHVGIWTLHRSCVRSRIARAICSDCGSFSDSIRYHGGSYFCPACISNRFVHCNRCGVARRVNDGMVSIHSTDERNGFLCPDCALTMTRCSRCERLFEKKTDKTGGLCIPCFIRNNPSRKRHRYSYKPKPKMHGKTTIQYGLELEVDGFPSHDHSGLGLAVLYKTEKGETSFYVKEDGSLTECGGYELVFHPRELGSWYSYEKRLIQIADSIRDSEGKSYNTSTCGIHVHRGNTDISGYHIVKMSYLLAKFRRLTRAVAMRQPNHYAHEANVLTSERKADPRKLYNLFFQTKLSPRERRYNVDRYLQLNFQNEHTIELRIFKGNLNVEAILSCIMFFDRLVEFTRKQTIKSMEQMEEHEMVSLFNGFCKTMTTHSTLGKRKNNAFAKVSSVVTKRIETRLAQALSRNND